jgi:para-nitrobenzyl esterase
MVGVSDAAGGSSVRFESASRTVTSNANYVCVDTDSGKIRGSLKGDIVAFKGIPYAAPTGGVNRFRAPQPVSPWTGVRDTLRYGDRCVQERETFADAPIFGWYGQTEPFSENCCVLNIFTPALDVARRPVMIYIHGGGYFTGGGGGGVLDGSNLAKFGDVVVVTLNHRLNAFGYTNLSFCEDERFADAANVGQLDLIAALHWVNRNIAQFGGDPGNVTVFGQSGGGSKIMVLLAMPAAKGLFHRAINMSGATGTTIVPSSSTEPYVKYLLSELAIDGNSLEKLWAINPEALIKARLAAVGARGQGARPVVDRRHIVASPMDEEALPIHASVPLLMGNTATESTFYFANDPRNLALTETQLNARIRAQFHVDYVEAAEIAASFRLDHPDRTPSQILTTIIDETLFRVPMTRAAEAKSRANAAPVYMYNFNWTTPVDGGIWGAPHTIDIPFVFGTMSAATSLTASGAEQDEVSQNLMTAFIEFARTGNPNNVRMPEWRAYDTKARVTMTIGRECHAVHNYRAGDLKAGTALPLDPYDRSSLLTYRA